MGYQWNSEISTTDSLTTTDEVLLDGAEQGTLYVPAGSTITSVSFYVAPAPGGTFVALYSATTAVELTTTVSRAYAIPAAVFGARAMKMVCNTSGTLPVSLGR